MGVELLIDHCTYIAVQGPLLLLLPSQKNSHRNLLVPPLYIFSEEPEGKMRWKTLTSLLHTL